MTVTINGTTGIAGTNGSAGTPAVQGEDTNTGVFFPAADTVGVATAGTERLRVNSSGNVGIGTESPASALHLASTAGPFITFQDNDAGGNQASIGTEGTAGSLVYNAGGPNAGHLFKLNKGASEAARIDSDGNFFVGATSLSTTNSSNTGAELTAGGRAFFITSDNFAILAGRQTSDGTIITLRQAGVEEGTISVSGTTVSYNGGHLSRWAQFPDNSRPELLKGTVMSNLDQMSNWGEEDNEQLNCVQVSTVEGDANAAGVFVAWDSTDDGYNDILLAMTGDMVIRIGAGVTVARGDLLMSAGDGTAKPQGDDIVRSKTIAKVTSTHVSHTYADGSYAVPCVLMAC